MPEFQQTIAQPINFSGRGLHTGANVNVVLLPASPGQGIVFRRTDLPNQPEVKADCDLVVDVSRGTTLEYNGVKVSTIEHLMAALVGLGIDNITIEIDSQEMPILDGSAAPFVNFIEKAGIQLQDQEREYFVLDGTFHYHDPLKDVDMTAIPADDYSITVMIDFNSEVIGKQYAQLKQLSEFKEDFASSRTFCFLHEVEPLLESGLIKGGDLNNAIVVAEEEVSQERLEYLAKLFNQPTEGVNTHGIVNGLALRYKNEMARHKLVDVIGDLGLIGVPIKGKIIASKPGHAANVEFARKLKKYIREQKQLREVPNFDPNAIPVLDLAGIQKTLPHRAPFLLVDKIVEMSEKHIVGVKNVTFNEPFFVGHFPGNPIMPGVLQVEAMAQTGGVLALSSVTDPQNYLTYFLKIENCRFKQPVVPGDTMVIKMELLQPVKRGICVMRGVIYVGNQLVTEAELTAKIFKPS
jgi:UDP-3-O-[3-hydroxymyristoyl] N-acetylglucosamine deacetylase/3-hydroxyacyl-[acyl-carrier-protein] dehydratase